MRKPYIQGDIFKLFMVAYFAFRLLCDFLKPDVRVFLALSSIQWACLAMLLYYRADILRWVRSTKPRALEVLGVHAESAGVGGKHHSV